MTSIDLCSTRKFKFIQGFVKTDLFNINGMNLQQ